LIIFILNLFTAFLLTIDTSGAVYMVGLVFLKAILERCDRLEILFMNFGA